MSGLGDGTVVSVVSLVAISPATTCCAATEVDGRKMAMKTNTNGRRIRAPLSRTAPTHTDAAMA
jgi:hypothetical protein